MSDPVIDPPRVTVAPPSTPERAALNFAARLLRLDYDDHELRHSHLSATDVDVPAIREALRDLADRLAAGAVLPAGTQTVGCDIDWTDLRSSRPGADVQSRSYVWPADEFDTQLTREVRAAERFRRAPVRIRKCTVTSFPDGSRLVGAWTRVELPS
ncbi:hypothetical protein AB0K35_28190 [Micromonospora sp. NPDC053740]|uniref:hypothetical protein n=1 Tax=Micromonospora sp. NPDC053740 TaxID=3155173 RepID=UPI0034204C94